jgi:hypothetical protein
MRRESILRSAAALLDIDIDKLMLPGVTQVAD